jgi:UPF0288 family protein (methanogenesis marker protein 3)
MAEGCITVEAGGPTRVFTVRLYEDLAPQTAAYFKTISGLKTRSLGRLTVFFAMRRWTWYSFPETTSLPVP